LRTSLGLAAGAGWLIAEDDDRRRVEARWLPLNRVSDRPPI